MSRRAAAKLLLTSLFFIACAAAATARANEPSLEEGDVIEFDNSRRATITLIDSLPFVQSEYARRFKFDRHDNPKLKHLRERFKLDTVISGEGLSEFDCQVLLLDWVHERFKRFGTPTSKARGALDILDAVDSGHTFFCAHYADVMVSAAASLGWVCRSMALRRPDHLGQGATEHSSTEIWSNQHRKWVLFDPTFAMYVEKAGVPLNAFEVRQEWFYRDGRDLVFVIGKDRMRYRKSDLPIVRKRFAGFGDLAVDESALNVYAFIGYIPNTDLMDSGPDYGAMFITRDALCANTKWHKRLNPANPATDPYFPINQSALSLAAGQGALTVNIRTLTPNFKTYLVRTDNGAWKPIDGDSFQWRIHDGENQLEAKTLNHFNVEGPVSKIVVGVK
jgi:hypothetical protein